jgi:5-methylcytosine-specific restriction endonuclease McrA
MECGWCEINPKSGNVPIDLDHIDGNSTNNNFENVRLLCPNCHSLTPTYKALNYGNGKHNRKK